MENAASYRPSALVLSLFAAAGLMLFGAGVGAGWFLYAPKAVPLASGGLGSPEAERQAALEAQVTELEEQRDELKTKVKELENRPEPRNTALETEVVGQMSLLEQERDRLASRVSELEQELLDREHQLRDAQHRLDTARLRDLGSGS